MELIPVIDLMDGRVVRGVSGNRNKYQPNKSCLVNSSSAIETVHALKNSFQTNVIYAADLDSLEGKAPSEEIIKSLIDTGVDIILDAGITCDEQARCYLGFGVRQIVIPLESLNEMEQLEKIINAVDTKQLIFSLDLKNGFPLGDAGRNRSPFELAQLAITYGIESIIVLDLAGVGTSQGVMTLDLCQQIREVAPNLNLISGGGVRSIEDCKHLKKNRIDGVLIASALHDGLITPQDWSYFQSSS